MIEDDKISKFERLTQGIEQSHELWILCQEEYPRRTGKVMIYPWKTGIQALIDVQS